MSNYDRIISFFSQICHNSDHNRSKDSLQLLRSRVAFNLNLNVSSDKDFSVISFANGFVDAHVVDVDLFVDLDVVGFVLFSFDVDLGAAEVLTVWSTGGAAFGGVGVGSLITGDGKLEVVKHL